MGKLKVKAEHTSIINDIIIHSENRYVLFLTENYAALDILKNPLNYLDEELTISLSQEGAPPVEPFILFGSSFPKDKEYTQVRSLL